ncbi:MAG: CoA-binding protein [Demequina sp.]
MTERTETHHDSLGDSNAEACPMPGSSEAPSDQILVDLLAQAPTVAVVGASPNPERTSHHIALWLMDHTPYEIYLVNPVAAGEEIRGHGFYPSVTDLPEIPTIVDVFRRSEHVTPVATEAIDKGAVALWMQLGVVNQEAASAASQAGLTVVQNRCIKIEYARLRDQIEAARG